MARSPSSQVTYGKFLAAELSDVEFETLLRERIRLHFASISFASELNDHYYSASFRYNPMGSDPAQWSISLGSGYNKTVNSTGEVLSKTVNATVNAYELQHTNKLSLLLEAPSGQTTTDDTSDSTGEYTGTAG